jgi:GNAT superfamily N-acetyltransferase
MKNAHDVRPIDRRSLHERQLVASRMRDTLGEVLGDERARAMFTDAWLLDRVEQHTDGRLDAEVFVAVFEGAIVGHSIVRRERDHRGEHGYISTTYVLPAQRRAGVARALVSSVEQWMLDRGLRASVTHTHPSNDKLRQLFTGLGYVERVVERGDPPERFAEFERAW